MLDETAFLRTILERPDDDGPRLVFADWLEERGETARAEFIRVQIELARLTERDDRREVLQQREDAILKRYRLRWQRRVAVWVRDCEFRRGIMEYACVSAAAFARSGERLFERAAVTRLRLNDVGRDLGRIAQSPLLARVRELDISSNRLTPDHLMPLVNARGLSQLQTLDVSANRLGDLGVAMLVRCQHLRGLRRLLLMRNGLSPAGMRDLGHGEWPELVHLDVSANRAGAERLAALLATPLARQLRSLGMANSEIGDAGAILLALSPALSHLTGLNLASAGLTDEGITQLANSPHLAALEWLDLSYNEIGGAGAEALATSRYLADLRHLSLAGTRLSRTAAELLRRRFGSRVDGLSDAG